MFEGIHSYADFPRSEQWLDQNLRRALRLDDSRSSAAH
jgi:hypothetical protein